MNGKWKYLYRAVDSEGNTLERICLKRPFTKIEEKRTLKKSPKARQVYKPHLFELFSRYEQVSILFADIKGFTGEKETSRFEDRSLWPTDC